MPRMRIIPTIVAWAGFIGLLLYQAADAPIADVFWINLAYMVILIGGGIAIWIGSVILIAHKLPGKPAIVFTGATVLALAFLALDQFWVRDWLAAQF